MTKLLCLFYSVQVLWLELFVFIEFCYDVTMDNGVSMDPLNSDPSERRMTQHIITTVTKGHT